MLSHTIRTSERRAITYLRVLTFTLSSLVIIALLPFRSWAIPLCAELQQNESSSCWQPNPEEIPDWDASRIEFSHPTLKNMLDISGGWVAPDSQVPLILEDLIQQSEDFPWQQGVGFFYDYQKGERDNSDCGFYFRRDIGAVDQSVPIGKPIEGPNCNKSAFEIALLAKQTGRKTSQNVVDPFDKFYFANHPVKAISGRIQKAIVGDQLLFELYNKLPTSNAWYKAAIPVPAWIFQASNPLPLKVIATMATGKQDDWRVIWALNIGRIKNPAVVPANIPVKIPANVVGWGIVKLDFENSEVYANKFYGNAGYGPLVVRYLEEAKSLGAAQAWLPVFSNEHDLHKVVVE